jgi:hypothetical protein
LFDLIYNQQESGPELADFISSFILQLKEFNYPILISYLYSSKNSFISLAVSSNGLNTNSSNISSSSSSSNSSSCSSYYYYFKLNAC